MAASSPLAMARDESLVVISSSPEFPLICDLVSKPSRSSRQPALRGGSNAAPKPSHAPKTIPSAGSIWQMTQQEEEEEEDQSHWNEPIDGAMKRRVSKFSRPIELSPDLAPEDTLRKPATKNWRVSQAPDESKRVSIISLDEEVDEPQPPQADALGPKKRGRKPKSETGMAQTTLPKGKVTKPVAKEKTAKKRLETVSKHFTKECQVPKNGSKTKTKLADQEEEPLRLEPAMQRRSDWTPPRETAPIHVISDTSALQDTSTLTDSPAWSVTSPKEDVFKSLRDTFGRNSDGESGNASSTDVLGKRKHIQMFVNAPSPAAPAGPPDQVLEDSAPKKAPKKKPRTITELATAAYRRQEVEASKTQGSLLGFVEVVDDENGEVNLPSGAKSKTKKKSTKPSASKKKADTRNHILLSPASAMRQVSRQDFVFGTSSQLAKEDDPDLLRALHEAMKVSNQADSDPLPISSPESSGLVVRKKVQSRLWGAGARDDDGALLDLEILDLTDSPPINNINSNNDDNNVCLPQKPLGIPQTSSAHKLGPAPNQTAVQSRTTALTIQEEDLSSDVLDLTDSPAIAATKSLFFATQKCVAPVSNQNEDEQPDWDDLDFMPPPSNQEQHQLLLSQAKSPSVRQPAELPRPSYEQYTDAQLARDVSKYGFKPVKKRTAMIALLNQCWASKNQPGLFTQLNMSTSAAMQATSKLASPRPRSGQDSSAPATTASHQPDMADYGSLKILDLKKLLQERSLKISGNKPELVARLQEDDKHQAAAPAKSPRGRPRKGAAPSPTKSPKSRPRSPAKRVTSPKRAASPRRSTSPKRGLDISTPRRRNSPIEIEDSDMESDSDDPFASSPSSSRGSRELSIAEEADMSLVASPTTQQVSMFAYITKAVTSAPRAKDPADPSWHEKMLMYDPIIVEDLTEWLNSGELSRVGYDAEVAPNDVKRWCESKSVCALWRVSNRGKERKRF
ncbi:putative structure-specific endonuclease subunit SLX4 [Cladorrhinum samala]|uniref:Structure-specific endonuclease subunit SLX4 n=1 Tax=Cladorrhinum samala TaxID=585594 RepID=A0AAV9I048_9PEZI|nr:putative structure-specific endonuclease subunit SLX4 [Cladorrhinum samala]